MGGTACQYLESLVKAQPASKRNQYWAGVGACMAGDVQAARSYMENSLMEECASDSERDICEFLTVEARRTLDILSSREVPVHQAACLAACLFGIAALLLLLHCCLATLGPGTAPDTRTQDCTSQRSKPFGCHMKPPENIMVA